MIFEIIQRRGSPSNPEPGKVYLTIDHWNDFSYVTQFNMFIYNSENKRIDIGLVKIGFKGQKIEAPTYKTLPATFLNLDDKYFSLGQDEEFYRNISNLPSLFGFDILNRIRDIVINGEIIEEIKNEPVFSTSLLRDVSLSIVRGQFHRALIGAAKLTNYNFRFISPSQEKKGGIALDFRVSIDSTPSTNIHALIGRNGVGKTTLLNGMINAITKKQSTSKFLERRIDSDAEISSDYFSSLVSVSFSAFDPFNPPEDQPDPAKGTCYFYVGLKDVNQSDRLRNLAELRAECVTSLANCFRSEAKTKRWLNAIEKLGSDENFAAMKLSVLKSAFEDIRNNKREVQSDSIYFLKEYTDAIDMYLSRMSSGHAIVLFTVTRLVDTVQEKTLVLMDEPESHLHPPLLSALIRALSDLLHHQNGVAIIATHSPVVLQEIPRSCVWKIHRVGIDISVARPSIETFAENVGTLTSEVFSLEVERSGFHALLEELVKRGDSLESILKLYNGQLGFEGKSILSALVSERESRVGE